jgi:hypothetical protein
MCVPYALKVVLLSQLQQQPPATPGTCTGTDMAGQLPGASPRLMQPWFRAPGSAVSCGMLLQLQPARVGEGLGLGGWLVLLLNTLQLSGPGRAWGVQGPWRRPRSVCVFGCGCWCWCCLCVRLHERHVVWGGTIAAPSRPCLPLAPMLCVVREPE